MPSRESIVLISPACATITGLRTTLCDDSTPLATRFRALFSLKNLAKQADTSLVDAAVSAIAAAFSSPSALLKHELAFCLGQSGAATAQEPLRQVLENLEEDPMVRHEAAEGLAALGEIDCLPLLRQFRDREGELDVVRETCEIAVDNLEWQLSGQARLGTKPSKFSSVDPAPPLHESLPTVQELQATLLNPHLSLFKRYRAMFSLRDLASPPDLPTANAAINALAKGFSDTSALFKHEIAYVLGQLAHPVSIPALTAVISNLEEAAMVRHEAAEALGALGEEHGVEELLRTFLHDRDQVVHESVVVALDMANYERSRQLEYALIPPTDGIPTGA